MKKIPLPTGPTIAVEDSGGAGTVDWPAMSGGAVVPYAGYTSASGSGATIASNAAANVKVTSNGSSDDKISGNTVINTLNWVATTQNGYLDIPAGTTLTFGAQGGPDHLVHHLEKGIPPNICASVMARLAVQ